MKVNSKRMVNVVDSRPLYQQVKRRIMEMIIDRRWPPGAYLPSEIALGKEFNVSQGTVRKALDDLAVENRVIRRQGKGTFVPEHTPERDLFQFFPLYGTDGERCLPDSRVISCRRQKATREMAEKLAVAPGTTIIFVKRIRDIEERDIIVEEIFLQAEMFPELGRPNPKDLPNALYHYYEREYGVTISRAEESLTAVAASQDDARLLRVDVGTPLLEIERRAMSLDGTIAEFRRSRCLTNEIVYLNHLE